MYCIINPNITEIKMGTSAFLNMSHSMNTEGLTPVDVKSNIKALRATCYLEMDKIQKLS